MAVPAHLAPTESGSSLGGRDDALLTLELGGDLGV